MTTNKNESESPPKVMRSRTSSNSSTSSSSSSSDSSSSSSSSSSHSPQLSPSNSKENSTTVKSKYKISPINTDESDADLSDSDPTFHLPKKVVPCSSSSSSTSDCHDDPGNSHSVNNNENSLEIKKTRKRTRNLSKWKQNITKALRNTGQCYLSASKLKKQVPARSIKDVCNNCRLKCSERISETERIDLFNNYWSLGNLELQRAYISSCMIDIKPKYRYTNAEKPRLPNSALYFTVNGNKIRVCKKYFINSLDESDRQLRTVKKKINLQGFIEKDRRGKHENRKQVDPTLLQDIKNHINSIPKIESHYLRATSSKEYISDSKTIRDLWKDFNDQQKEKSRLMCDYWLYINTFNKDFNIGFFQPKKDRCDTCLAYELASNDRKLIMKTNYENHLAEKDLCRQEKRTDRENIDGVHFCAVFDLQSVMLCPSPSYFYYSSKINCLNFTITQLNKIQSEDNRAYGDVYCYFWDETQGLRGANEIGSCVLDYLSKLSITHPNEQLHVTFYSDNCIGQNKNKVIASLYSYAVTHFHNIHTITHKYFIKGHTHNEADNVHSLIEKEIKKNEKAGPIYIPYQYVTLIKSARKTGKPFIVKELNYDFFLNLKKLQDNWGYNYNEDCDKNNIIWNDIKTLRFHKDNPFIFYCKTSYKQTEFSTINMRNKRKKMLNIDEIIIEKLYEHVFDLKENKKKDLKELVRKNLIPNYYAGFYNLL
jgi:hypothetical protein